MATNFLPSQSLINMTNSISGLNPNPCPDQFRGTYSNGTFNPAPQSNRLNVDYNSSPLQTTYSGNVSITNPVIAVVLESPHKSEYTMGLPLGPARGTTGRLFDSEFPKLFSNSIWNSHFLSATYDVILLNGVQFQCSLGQPLNNIINRQVRDNNWLDIFNNYGGNVDIVGRLNALNPVLIINLCTKGYSNLQMILDRQLKANFNCPNTLGTHPSTWNFPYARIF